MIHLAPPAHFVPQFSAVGCFVETDSGDILQLLRSKSVKIEPEKWGAPAGKDEPNETPDVAMARELKEETGLIVSPDQLKHVKTFFIEYPGVKFTYDLFRLVYTFKPVIKLSDEHVAFVWIPPAYANSLALMEDEWECIKAVYNL